MRPLFALTFIVMSIACFVPVCAQQPSPAAKDQLPEALVQDVPGAASCPSPDWLKPGMRITYSSTSSVRKSASGAGLRPCEPHETPDFEDTAGRKWKYDTANPSSGNSSGQVGWMNLDVIAAEPGMLVLQRTNFLLPLGYANPAKQTTTEPLFAHSSGSRFVLHPALLKQVKQVDDPTLTILQRGFRHNNQDFNALHVVVRQGGFQMEVYDLSSGVLLAGGYRADAKGRPVLTSNDTVTNADATMQVNYRFVTGRAMNLPWMSGSMPDWVRTMKRMRFAGSKQLKIETYGQPDLPAVPITLDVATQAVGQTWALYATAYSEIRADGVPSIPDEAQMITGPGSVLGMWRDPATLRGLVTGQIIDQDPTTGQTLSVEYAGTGADGRTVVAITAATAVQKLTNVFDARDGRLVQVVRVDHEPSVPSTTIYTLNLVGSE